MSGGKKKNGDTSPADTGDVTTPRSIAFCIVAGKSLRENPAGFASSVASRTTSQTSWSLSMPVETRTYYFPSEDAAFNFACESIGRTPKDRLDLLIVTAEAVGESGVRLTAEPRGPWPYSLAPKTWGVPSHCPLTLNEYQQWTNTTAAYPDCGRGTTAALSYCALGLGEAGEVQGKVKKLLRGDENPDKGGIADELGDVLWYVARMALEFGMSLEDVAKRNQAKIKDRASRQDQGF